VARVGREAFADDVEAKLPVALMTLELRRDIPS
jgi:hypothetical protein